MNDTILEKAYHFRASSVAVVNHRARTDKWLRAVYVIYIYIYITAIQTFMQHQRQMLRLANDYERDRYEKTYQSPNKPREKLKFVATVNSRVQVAGSLGMCRRWMRSHEASTSPQTYSARSAGRKVSWPKLPQNTGGKREQGNRGETCWTRMPRLHYYLNPPN